MSQPATGTVVRDADAARRLHRKANAGVLRSDGLHLHPSEAAYCIAKGWLEAGAGLSGMDEDGLAHALVYADWRTRGFVARIAADGSLEVLPRGKAEGPAELRAIAHPAERPLAVAALDGAVGGVLCVVDEDGLVTHYRVEPDSPAGQVTARPKGPVQGRMAGGKVLVPATEALAKGFWGNDHGGARLLSAAEAALLAEVGTLQVVGGTPQAPPAQLAAMRALRAAGVVPKSGLRFGTHLRAYATAPDEVHADWLVHCLDDGEALPCSDLARGVRLAHGVRKRFLVAIAGRDGVRFRHVAWVKV